MRHDSGLHEGPVRGINWKWRGARNGLSLSSVVDGRPPQATQRVQATRYEPERVKEITAFASPGALPAFRAATAPSTRRPIGITHDPDSSAGLVSATTVPAPIRARTRRAAAGRALDRQVDVRVLASGSGFRQACTERAFDRFARTDRREAPSGAGLSLAIVRPIAQAHGGEARASNRPDGPLSSTLPSRPRRG